MCFFVQPRLLDEYSDPFDLKKQIAENPEVLGGLGVEEEDVKSVSDDDYSVPFEIKNMRGKRCISFLFFPKDQT